jgi:hypothetical protein
MCTHEDEDGFWPAGSLWGLVPDAGVDAWVLAQRCLEPTLPEGYEWASKTLYVHQGPVVGLTPEPRRSVAITREVRPA